MAGTMSNRVMEQAAAMTAQPIRLESPLEFLTKPEVTIIRSPPLSAPVPERALAMAS